MKLRHYALFLVIVLAFAFPLQSTKVNKADLEATHIVLGQVENVEGYYGVTEWGDELIYSRVKVKVDKYLKGRDGRELEFSVEGGEVGEVGLRVSESPVFRRGERVKLHLKKTDAEFELLESRVVNPAKTLATLACCSTFAAWPSGSSASYYINPDKSDLSSSTTISDVTGGAQEWNNAAARGLLSNLGTTSVAATKRDNMSVIFFRQTKKGSTIAVTYTWYNTRTKAILEFDMLFYAGGWAFFESNKTCNKGFYLKVIATHELGHAIGLNHNNCPDSIMYPYADYCTDALLTADDKACVGSLY